MLPWCKMNDEELEAVVGGMHAGLEEISTPVEDPLPREGARFILP